MAQNSVCTIAKLYRNIWPNKKPLLQNTKTVVGLKIIRINDFNHLFFLSNFKVFLPSFITNISWCQIEHHQVTDVCSRRATNPNIGIYVIQKTSRFVFFQKRRDRDVRSEER